jgi:hypothetical protein
LSVTSQDFEPNAVAGVAGLTIALAKKEAAKPKQVEGKAA